MKFLRDHRQTVISDRMNKRNICTTLLLVALGLGACGGTESAAGVIETSAVESPAATEEATPVTDAAPQASVAANAPAEQPTTTEATPTEPTEPTRTETETASPSEAISAELEVLSVLRISLGAGSGEYDILIDRRPEGLNRFKVSTAGGDGYCNSQVLATQDTSDGVVITVLPDCGGTTFGVAWVHVDGRRSDIAYRDCSAGITYERTC